MILPIEYIALETWLNEIIYSENYVEIKKEAESIRIYLYTDNHRYSIVARLPRGGDDNNSDKGYLGCTALMRKTNVRETWCRGSDLSDGSYNYATWLKIVKDIVKYELIFSENESNGKTVDNKDMY